MALINSKIKYKTIRDALINLLKTNINTINSELTTSIISSSIKGGNPYIYPIPIHPFIMVSISTKTESFEEVGIRKQAEINFSIYAIIKQMKSEEDCENELINITDNIESIIRDNIQFTSDILYCFPSNVDFAIGNMEGSFIMMSSIQVNCIVEIK